MRRDFNRLFRPRTIAVIGGGAWCRQVIQQLQKMGFTGEIWPVHPKATELCGLPVFASVEALPAAPDASFIGVNRYATVEVVAALSRSGAGGAVCFASGFLEAQKEASDAADLQQDLLHAAGDMPILGPNCYGFINYLDGALLWPDQHGGAQVAQGVAILTQSSNIAINLTMQARGLPIAYMITVGNQAQSDMAEIARDLLEDPRVTAIGLHIEGIRDLRAFEALAQEAAACGKPIVALKVGRSDQAQAATLSHTASLAGQEAGAAAFLRRCGIARVDDLPVFLETLKILHVLGPRRGSQVATISCSGGEASLAADLGQAQGVTFPPLSDGQHQALRAALGPMVALANPLDYHTYIWRDVPAMTQAFSAMVHPDLDLLMLIVDFPRENRCSAADWACAIEAAVATRMHTGAPLAMVATLPELMPEEIADRLLAAGVVPLCGLREAMSAAMAASQIASPSDVPALLPRPDPDGVISDIPLVPEGIAKQRLAATGLRIPRSCRLSRVTLDETLAEVTSQVGFPLVLKAEGLAHKSEAGAVRLALGSQKAVVDAAREMPGDQLLLEEMITGTVAELLIGVTRDPAHGFVLTLGAGGVWTELLEDSVSLLLPVSDTMLEAALGQLRITRLLDGYRGAPAADRPAVLRAVRAVERYVLAHSDTVEEIEINPLICTPSDAIAVDALLREKELTHD
ncbi:Acyl-CoA synthetase (NDP forming) [Phaeobacter piscinae]|uniref:Acyl-CoA synthetase (NDP forming) n=1 Tax=Phaeobacter piscinae TaxID=1580596 RepID=A0ABM6PI12_9RHOB|nr:acetate--CoA ligase family protein [Phaeobacter piscinae]ATG37329.1 Acyl-CoA synthetase (NDP forming) [Phaeobacter piscinae]AUQ87850.1 Acyl-CoA synthetase (NDP forming) [Phaeobacter piscinae]AUR25733.1 Acyl-CoA synthetase (NDP forming) [Phaeobacter piscinae]